MANLRVRQPQLADENDRGGQVPERLGATASTADRIEALTALLDVEELAEALDVSAPTIRNWLSGHASPRRGALRTLDDLRRTVLLLAEAEIEGEEAAQWLRSRQGGALDNDRPLDVIAADPLRVLATATGKVIEAEEEGPPELKAIED